MDSINTSSAVGEMGNNSFAAIFPYNETNCEICKDSFEISVGVTFISVKLYLIIGKQQVIAGPLQSDKHQ